MQSQQFYVHYLLVKTCSLKPFLNFDNESNRHILENLVTSSIYLYIYARKRILKY